MKFKRAEKKLALNKATVTNLDSGQMNVLFGGVNFDAAAPATDYKTCVNEEDTKDFCNSTGPSLICCPLTNYSCPYPPTQNPIPACLVQRDTGALAVK